MVFLLRYFEGLRILFKFHGKVCKIIVQKKKKKREKEKES